MTHSAAQPGRRYHPNQAVRVDNLGPGWVIADHGRSGVDVHITGDDQPYRAAQTEVHPMFTVGEPAPPPPAAPPTVRRTGHTLRLVAEQRDGYPAPMVALVCDDCSWHRAWAGGRVTLGVVSAWARLHDLGDTGD